MGSYFGELVHAWSAGERRLVRVALAGALLAAIAWIWLMVSEHSIFIPVAGGAYAEGILGQPTNINPLIAGTPADQDVAALVFSPLQTLTENVDVSADSRVYRVTLREDLVWDDGEPLTSDDVLFSIRLIQNPAAHSPLFRNWEQVTVERVSALQFLVTLRDPYVFFGEHLAAVRVLPQHIYGAVPPENFSLSSYALRPVGNGPYRVRNFVARNDGFITEYRLTRNDRYAGPRPFIEDFALRFYETEAELQGALRLREVQGTGSLMPFPAAFRDIPGIQISEFPMARYYAVFFNQVNNPMLKSRNLREALSLAIDRTKLVAGVFAGHGEPIASPVVPAFFDMPASTTLPKPSFDPEQARALLAAANIGTTTLTFAVPKTPILEATARLLQEAWTAIGVSVTVVPVEPSALATDVVRTRNYDLLLFGNILADPADLFPFWHSSQRSAGGANLALYENVEVDAALERIRQTLPANERPAELSRAANRIAADIPAVFLVSMPYLYAHTERLGGFSPQRITMPADRFAGVARWSVTRARILE
ncbi:MAG: peptide ABC transporter substrate-binding protein [bacterium]|nr:peptide ABC transporter substrate-binding protein [bacterium]